MTQFARLGDVADVVAGVGFPKEMQGKEDAEVPVFKVGDISTAWTSGQRLLRSARNYLTATEAASLGRLVPAGATVFAKIGEALRLNRRAVLAQPSVVDNNVMGLVPRPEQLSPMYLFYFMQTVDLGKLSRATAVPSIRKSDVVEIPIPLRPLAEQDSIVAEIDKQFSRLDEAVASLKRVKANLYRCKATVLKAAVEGRLVLTEAELARREGRGYETGAQLLQRILETRRSQWKGKGKYKEPLAPYTNGPAELAKGWALASLDQLTSKITSGSRDWSKYYGKGKSVFVLAQNVRSLVPDFSVQQFVDPPTDDPSCERSRIEDGDLLATIVGANTGQVCLVRKSPSNAYVCQSVALIRPVLVDTAAQLNYWLNSDDHGQRYFDQCMYGQGRPHLSFEQLAATPIGVPPIAEQHRIVAELDRRLSLVHGVEAEVAINLQRVSALRGAVLKKAFALTPDDENNRSI